MTGIAVAVAVVLALGCAVAWALVRFLHEVARYDDWDAPPIKAKREHWR